MHVSLAQMGNDTLTWLVPAVITALGVAYLAGKQIQAAENQRLATKALHKRLDRQKSRVEALWERAIATGQIRPTQTGVDDDGDEG
jgi:hypothetical protein